MRCARLLIAALLACLPAFGQDLVLVNGTIIDGSGNPRVAGNVRIKNGVIADIGPFKAAAGETTLDIKGLVVAPGFIDIHSESAARAQLLKGITTAILGQDGAGPIGIEEYMKPLDYDPIPMNVVALVGHTALRRAVLGTDWKRAATTAEIKQMEDYLEIGMREGGYGLSVGLDREPGQYANAEELITLGKTVARYGGFLVLSLRDRTDKILESVREAIDVSRKARVPVHIAALTGLAPKILPLIDQARLSGLDITADVSTTAFNRSRFVMPGGEASFPLPVGPSLTLESAVRKMSGLPASRLSFKQRGTLKKGNAADIVVFDPAAISKGMRHVFVNGVLVVKDGQLTDAKPGRAIR